MFFTFKRVAWHLSVTQLSLTAGFVTRMTRPADATNKRIITSTKRLYIAFSLTKERFKNQKILSEKDISPALIVSAKISF
jgi:hypothetical protein